MTITVEWDHQGESGEASAHIAPAFHAFTTCAFHGSKIHLVAYEEGMPAHLTLCGKGHYETVEYANGTLCQPCADFAGVSQLEREAL